jgi:hypothetical protein
MFLAFAAVLVFVSTGYADMMPVFRADTGVSPARAGECAAFPAIEVVNLSVSDSFHAGSLPVDLQTTAQADAEPAGTTRPVCLLNDEQNSFGLCLYALLGLGLCKSAPLVRKLHFGAIPEWYHDGGPLQVGHSHAISPDCLTAAPVYCFIQPDCGGESPMPQYREGTVASLWRVSQFTPTVLASRGPPTLAHDSSVL